MTKRDSNRESVAQKKPSFRRSLKVNFGSKNPSCKEVEEAEEKSSPPVQLSILGPLLTAAPQLSDYAAASATTGGDKLRKKQQPKVVVEAKKIKVNRLLDEHPMVVIEEVDETCSQQRESSMDLSSFLLTKRPPRKRNGFGKSLILSQLIDPDEFAALPRIPKLTTGEKKQKVDQKTAVLRDVDDGDEQLE